MAADWSKSDAAMHSFLAFCIDCVRQLASFRGSRQMPATTLEILVPIFNFSGAAILCKDALRIKQNIKEKVGAKELLDYLQAVNKPGAVRDEQGKPLDSQVAIDRWLAHRDGWRFRFRR